MPRAIYEVGPFAALGCAFRCTTNDLTVAAYLDGLFRHLLLPAGAAPVRVYHIEHIPPLDSRSSTRAIRTYADGELLQGAEREATLRALIRDVDNHLIAHSPHLLLHASGAVHNGRGIAFPGSPGSGKSTLVAGLVRAGLGYLTDEFTAPDWETGELHPYPRAISLNTGAWPMFSDVEPSVPAGVEPLLGGQWQVDAEALRAGSISGPCRLRYVVFPRYVFGASTQLRPLSRADALVKLINYTFRFHSRPSQALKLLGTVVGDCECYDLTIGDLGAACASIGRLLDDDESQLAISSPRDELSGGTDARSSSATRMGPP